MAEKSDDGIVEDILERIDGSIRHDRERLSEILDKLISVAADDADRTLAVAEAVAKIADAMTKQNHLRIESAKIVAKRSGKKDDGQDAFDDIGRPFEVEHEN